jgi:hypothetical protein
MLRDVFAPNLLDELTFRGRLGDTICGNYKATLFVLLPFAVLT